MNKKKVIMIAVLATVMCPSVFACGQKRKQAEKVAQLNRHIKATTQIIFSMLPHYEKAAKERMLIELEINHHQRTLGRTNTWLEKNLRPWAVSRKQEIKKAKCSIESSKKKLERIAARIASREKFLEKLFFGLNTLANLTPEKNPKLIEV